MLLHVAVVSGRSVDIHMHIFVDAMMLIWGDVRVYM